MTLANADIVRPRDASFETVDDLTRALGGIPAHRILLRPIPGTATEDDLLQKIERDDMPVEMIERTLVKRGRAGYESEFIGAALIAILQPFVMKHRLGLVGGSQAPTRMSGGNVRMPDVFFISRERLAPKVALASRIGPVAPDLSVEIFSASNTRAEMRLKRQELFRSGTRLVWEVDPADRTVAVYTSPEVPDVTLDRTATLTGGDVLPGFMLDLAAFWAQFDDT